jgi:hypothetical protein
LACCLWLILLLAADLRAGDQAPFFGTNESSHLRRALARLNMTERDLGFEKDVGKPLWALSWIRETLRTPLLLPQTADRILKATGTNAPQDVWRLAGELLEAGPGPATAFAAPVRSGESVAVPAPVDPILAGCLREFAADAIQVESMLARAWGGLSSTQMSYAAAACLAGAFNAEDHPAVRPLLVQAGIAPEDIDSIIQASAALDPIPGASNSMVIAMTIQMADLLAAGKRFCDAVTHLACQAAEVQAWPLAPIGFDTPAGRIVVGSRGDDLHTNAALVILDPAGDDRWEGAAGTANGLQKRSLGAIVDLAGRDRYAGRGILSPGSALFGVTVIMDGGGDDVYQADYTGQGAAVFGVAWLEDAEGADTYRGGGLAQGAAVAGLGVLLDRGGDDIYGVGLCGQAYAGCRGAAFLIDNGGNDRYLAGGREPDWERLEDRFVSLAQGCAMGDRPVAGGGVAALVDWGGNDTYTADVYGQGVGYWYAAGFLLDMGGNDTYYTYQYGQGAGIHLSAGLLFDGAGNDLYAGHALLQGNAHDYSVGMLLDHGGNDTYLGESSAQGRALFNSFALLVESSGDDVYLAGEPEVCQGIGHDGGPREYGSLGVLMDLAGQDRYSCGATNGGVLQRPWYGVVYDVDTNSVGAR